MHECPEAKVNTGYWGGSTEGSQRVVVLMPKGEADAVDEWGIPAGMLNRTPAVRYLLRKGLDAVKAQENRQATG